MPIHIIFGSKDPSNRAPRLRKKGDRFYSASNYNLTLDDEYSGPPNLGEFIMAIGLGGWPHGNLHTTAYDKADILETDLALCFQCRTDTKVACALFQKPDAHPPADASILEVGRALSQGVSEGLRYCPLIQRLLTMTETPAERKFYAMYFQWAMEKVNRVTVLKEAYGSRLLERLREEGVDTKLGSQLWSYAVYRDFMVDGVVPALIPQVAINIVIPGDLPENHPDKAFYESNEGRIDFMFVGLGKAERHLVQIDGPWHHRTEEEYTRLLRRDRTMRKQGWHVHRFSNKEVMGANTFDSFGWELFSIKPIPFE